VRLPPLKNLAGESMITEGIGEIAFMAYILEQLLTSERQPTLTFTAEEHEAMQEEHIGADFLRHPFLY
jgi:hypothetical protein